MSFSSAQWTIPELCVWIVTRDRAALNSMPPWVTTLQQMEAYQPGTYAVRDDIVAAAQSGELTVSCTEPADPDRKTRGRVPLTPAFWQNAEIADARGSWMSEFGAYLVARRVDNLKAEFSDLRVESVHARQIWQPSTETKAEAPAPTVAPSPASDAEVKAWMIAHQNALKSDGKPHGRDVILPAARERFGILHKVALEFWDTRKG